MDAPSAKTVPFAGSFAPARFERGRKPGRAYNQQQMARRRLAAGTVATLLAAAAAGSAAWGSGAFEATPARPQPAGAVGPAATPARTRLVLAALARDEWVHVPIPGLVRDRPEPQRLRLWVGGDSTSVYMGGALADITRQLNGVVAGDEHRTSSGLSRPDFFDWPAFLRSEMARTNPNVVVVMFGANDPQGLVTVDGQVVQPLSEGWRAEYTRRVAATMELLAAPDRLQVWVGQPVMEPEGFNNQMKVVDAIYAEQAALRTDAIFVDSYTLFATPAGGYRDGGPGPDGAYVTWRAADGIHFTVAGGQYLAQAVMGSIRSNLDLVTN
jgi:hypothetical protein